FLSLAADDDAGARGVDVDLQVAGGALVLDHRHAGVVEAVLEVLLQRQVLVQEIRVVLVREPARLPGLVEPDAEPVRVNFLTHSYSLAFAVLAVAVFAERFLGAAAALATA